MVVALTVVLSFLLTSAALGAAGVGRPKKAAPPDPKTQRLLNLSGNGLRLAPPKRARSHADDATAPASAAAATITNAEPGGSEAPDGMTQLLDGEAEAGPSTDAEAGPSADE